MNLRRFVTISGVLILIYLLWMSLLVDIRHERRLADNGVSIRASASAYSHLHTQLDDRHSDDGVSQMRSSGGPAVFELTEREVRGILHHGQLLNDQMNSVRKNKESLFKHATAASSLLLAFTLFMLIKTQKSDRNMSTLKQDLIE